METEAHAWCCYVRGVDGEDISKFIKRVVFELDPSFPEPKISIETPPFEVHQVGWGQFSIGIKLFFHDPVCKPVEVFKDLILFDDSMPSSKRPIVNEDYNELIFIEPSPQMFEILCQKHLVQSAANQNGEAANGSAHESSKQEEAKEGAESEQ